MFHASNASAMLESQSLINLLSRLHIAFDEAILNGNSFEEVKKIYLQIKDTEKKLADRRADELSGNNNHTG